MNKQQKYTKKLRMILQSYSHRQWCEFDRQCALVRDFATQVYYHIENKLTTKQGLVDKQCQLTKLWEGHGGSLGSHCSTDRLADR